MHPMHPFFSVIIFGIAFLTAYVINKKYKFYSPSGRFESIDGLRGFLALGVFIHHSNIWHDYLRSGTWKSPASNLYAQLGQTSVALFFMITSFLFLSKLINAREKEFNWRIFFVSRIFRLVPMYYVSVGIVVFFVMFISNWKLSVSISQFASEIIRWGLFRTPNINNEPQTLIINAGVIWSLSYEWLFYGSLPLISLFILKKRQKVYEAGSALFILLYAVFSSVVPAHIHSFMGGAVATIAGQFFRTEKKLGEIYGTAIILFCLWVIGQFDSAENIICKSAITLIFTLIATEQCTLFGLLRNSTLKFLGEICYSTYLIHGIILYITFTFGFGLNHVANFTPFEYSLSIFGITPLVVLFSLLCFKYVEKPFMDFSKSLMKKHPTLFGL